MNKKQASSNLTRRSALLAAGALVLSGNGLFYSLAWALQLSELCNSHHSINWNWCLAQLSCGNHSITSPEIFKKRSRKPLSSRESNRCHMSTEDQSSFISLIIIEIDAQFVKLGLNFD